MKLLRHFLTLTLSVAALTAAGGLARADGWLSDIFGGRTDLQTAMPAPTATSITDAGSSQLASLNPAFRDGSFTGPVYDAYYGMVQVQANVQGGRLISVDVLQYPTHRNTSRAINRQAIPMLEREVIRAQSVRVNLISGATLTSEAYLKSLYVALKQARI